VYSSGTAECARYQELVREWEPLEHDEKELRGVEFHRDPSTQALHALGRCANPQPAEAALLFVVSDALDQESVKQWVDAKFRGVARAENIIAVVDKRTEDVFA
jgi:hypothetical protein